MNTELMQKYEDIKKEIEKLSGQLGDLASMSSDQLEGYKDKAFKEVSATAKDVSDEAMQQAKKIDEYTHENPWIVAAGFSIAGLLLGLFLSSTKDKK